MGYNRGLTEAAAVTASEMRHYCYINEINFAERVEESLSHARYERVPVSELD